MNSKNFGYIGLIVVVVLIILSMWLDSVGYESPAVQLKDTFLCEKSGDKWIQVDKPAVGEDVYICGRAKSNVQELHKQIQIRVYEGERGLLERPVFYDNIWISNGDLYIPLRIYLDPGNYTVEVSSGRKILSTLQIKINDS